MLLSVIIMIVCVLLVIVVLIQNSKGGGIQSQFGVANQIMGVKRGADVIEKATWTLAILLLALSMYMTPRYSDAASQEIKSRTKDKAAGAVMPAAPAAPANNNAAPQGGAPTSTTP